MVNRRRLLEHPAEDPVISDWALVQAAREDTRHFLQIYERYADRIYWYALPRTRSATVADDVVSETFLTALERLGRFDPARGSFAGWIFTIARNKVIDQQRYHRRLWRFVSRQGASTSLDAEQAALEQMLRAEEIADVHSAYQQLSASDKEIISLRYSAGLASQEIGDVLGITAEAARKRLSRATQRIASLLEIE